MILFLIVAVTLSLLCASLLVIVWSAGGVKLEVVDRYIKDDQLIEVIAKVRDGKVLSLKEVIIK